MKKDLSTLKVAFSGASGSGKTTLVTFVKETLGLNHISGSAGDLKEEDQKAYLRDVMGYPGGGHIGVIKYSALHPQYGLENQRMLLEQRTRLIRDNQGFVTDRSPIDNAVYFTSQCGYAQNDKVTERFLQSCLDAFEELTHLIYVKAVQPDVIENNGSRIDNIYYQKALIDPSFEWYLMNYFMKKSVAGPEVLIIDFWDLQQRKEVVTEFLTK